MKPLQEWHRSDGRPLIGIFTDIDDTLTTEGVITPDALRALAELKAAGLLVFAITGRPIGWCELFANGDAARGIAPWPVDALVAENGAVAYAPQNLDKNSLQPLSNKRKQLSKLYQQSLEVRTRNQSRMQQIAVHVQRSVPGVQLSRDSTGRETDLAFDYAEFARLPPEAVQQVLDLLQAAGMQTTVSSIHIHGCFGDFNKWQGACWIVRALLGRDLTQELDRWVFVGDSGNDETMFAHFTNSVGVANIHRCAAQLKHLPRYVTPSERGAGFAEVAGALLNARAT